MVFEGDLLPADPSIVVVPLLLNYPAVRYLNPDIVHDGARYVFGNAVDYSGKPNKIALDWECQWSRRSNNTSHRCAYVRSLARQQIFMSSK